MAIRSQTRLRLRIPDTCGVGDDLRITVGDFLTDPEVLKIASIPFIAAIIGYTPTRSR